VRFEIGIPIKDIDTGRQEARDAIQSAQVHDFQGGSRFPLKGASRKAGREDIAEHKTGCKSMWQDDSVVMWRQGDGGKWAKHVE